MVTDDDVERYLAAHSARNPKESDMPRPEFAVHMLNEQGRAKAVQLAEAFSRLLDEVEAVCPAGRELSVAKTNLETASYYAKRAMAQQPENWEGGAPPPPPGPEARPPFDGFHRR